MSYDYRLDKYYDDAEAETELSEDLVTQLNTAERYSSMDKIAQGGMKTIYKAFDAKNQRYIAYATLNKDSDCHAQESFIKEARLTAKLSHPNIIPIYNIGLDEKRIPFFTMELKTGDSLKGILQTRKAQKTEDRDPDNLKEFLGIFIKVCDAIDFAHSKKVLHLDIKPDNIQVGSYGEVIVCDWGLSKIYDQQTDTIDLNQKLLSPEKLNTATLNGLIKGSPGYMAPEQVLGEKKTPQTDIFSLGCLLYSLLCLEAPFKSGDLKEVLDDTLTGNYSLPENIPKSLQAVLCKAIATKPEERYESVSKLKREVENFLNGYATQAEGASSLKLLQLFINRNKALSLISCLSLLIIIFGTITFISNIKTEKDRAEDNLRLLKAQKAETNKAQHDYYQALIDHNNSIFHINYLDDPIAIHRRTTKGLLRLITAYPDLNEAKSALAYHYFVAQKYQESYKYLKKNPGIYSYMLPHLEKYKDTKKDSEFLSPEAFTKLLSEIKPYKTLHHKKLIFYGEVTKNKEDVIPAIKHLFQRLNPQWDPNNFNYHADSQRINIYGMNFKHLSEADKISPLQALSIKSLSIQNTNVEDISSLKDIPIRALNITNTKITFGNLKKNLPKALLRIVIQKDQFKKWQMAKFPGIIEFVESDQKKPEDN